MVTTEAAAFQFDGAGDGFHLLPFAPGQGVRLHLLHFSGAGYGPATNAEMSVVPAPPRSLDTVQQNAASGLDDSVWFTRTRAAFPG